MAEDNVVTTLIVLTQSPKTTTWPAHNNVTISQKVEPYLLDLPERLTGYVHHSVVFYV